MPVVAVAADDEDFGEVFVEFGRDGVARDFLLGFPSFGFAVVVRMAVCFASGCSGGFKVGDGCVGAYWCGRLAES